MFKKLFKRRETEGEVLSRLNKLSTVEDDCIPSIDAQTALNELCRFFLGEDWYVVTPMNTQQVNHEIVYEIETRYKGKR